MKETALDPKLYRRAIERAATRTAVMRSEETLSEFMRRVSITAMESFEDEVDAIRDKEGDRLRPALEEARKMFAFYAEQHHAKNTAESTAKAVVNEDMVAMITHALESY